MISCFRSPARMLCVSFPGILLALGACPALVAQNPAPSSHPSSSLINPSAIAYDAPGGKIYAVDLEHNRLQVATVARHALRQVAVGRAPVALAIDAGRHRVYVCNAGEGTVSVIDERDDSLVTTLQVGVRPYSIAVNATAGRVYLTHTFNDDITVIDEATLTVQQRHLGSRDLIAVDEPAGTVYLLGYESTSMTVLQGAGELQTQQPTGGHIWGTAVDADGNLYIARIGRGDLAIVRRGQKAITSITSGAMPCSVVLDEAAHLAYVANYAANTVAVIDLAQQIRVAEIPAGPMPQGLAFDPQQHLLYAANTHANQITVINTVTRKMLGHLPTGRAPFALAAVPGSGTVYAANQDGLAAIDVQTLLH